MRGGEERGGEGEGRRGEEWVRGGEGEGEMMEERGETSRNEGTMIYSIMMRWNSIEYCNLSLQQHTSQGCKVCYSFNSRGSVIIELLCKASGTLQAVSGGGTSTPLTGGRTGQTEATARLKILYTQ